MKIVHFDDWRLGILAGPQQDRVIDVTDHIKGTFSRPQDRLEALITHWPDYKAGLDGLARGVGGVALGSVRLRAAVPKPGQLACAAVNYLEEGRPEKGEFNGFLKSPNSIVGDGDTVELPEAPVTHFHFEPELGLVIGKRAAHVKARDALNHVFGYVAFIDGSARGLPGGFFLGKSWHSMAPLGPTLVTADEVGDANKLEVKLSLNGKPKHTYSTSLMARHIPELLEEMTKVIALEPGDVVATGVHHTALFPVQDGDKIEVAIEKLGPPLRVSVKDPLKRTWER